MSLPAVTVLVPVYNGARHLRESLESIFSQQFTDFELLVIDDGSVDGTADILSDYSDPRLRILRNERNLGLVDTLNRGLTEARGEWIARQDADDISSPERLRVQMSFVRGNPSVPLIGSDAWLIDDRGRYFGRWRTGGYADLVAWDLCFRAPFAHGSALFRRSVIKDRIGGYRNLHACEDLDLWSRVAMQFPIVTLRKPLMKYRQHNASIMAAAAQDHARKKVLKEILTRYIALVAPGLGEIERTYIAAAWSGEEPKWREYFEAVRALEWNFLRGRRKTSAFIRMVAEQHYALYFRNPNQRRVILEALAKVDWSIFFWMPWLRMAAAWLRR